MEDNQNNEQKNTQQILQENQAGNSGANNSNSSNNENDLLGIFSIVAAFIFPPAGLVMGIIGRKDALKQGRSTTLSTVGIWLNAGLMIMGALGFILFFLFFFGLAAA